MPPESVYLDSSVILRKLLGQAGAMAEWGIWKDCYTSEISYVESMRALDRLRLLEGMADAQLAEKIKQLGEILESVEIININKTVLWRASQSFATTVKTLDAVHLASAILWREHHGIAFAFLTHDVRLGIAAQALGFETRGFTLAQS